MNKSYWEKNLFLDYKELLESIKNEASKIDHDVRLMEVCGGHTNTIMRFGLREVMPDNVKLVSGPGCPVCVTGQKDIDAIIEIALSGVPVAAYGDMFRVPGSKLSLDSARAEKANVEMVYSAAEVLKLKEKHPEIVFFGIGFETTAPMSAFLLEKGIPVYSTHKILVPGLKALLDDELQIDGFIIPGHVSVITGTDSYSDLDIPMAVSGFEPEHLLRSIYALLKMINEEKTGIINTYKEAVGHEGNKKAQDLIKKHFVEDDSEWRGVGVIPGSGYEVKDDSLNAKKIYKEIIDNVPEPKATGCKCGEVLKGIITPKECPLFKKVCNPNDPKGACMVSAEGACQIFYRFS